MLNYVMRCCDSMTILGFVTVCLTLESVCILTVLDISGSLGMIRSEKLCLHLVLLTDLWWKKGDTITLVESSVLVLIVRLFWKRNSILSVLCIKI